MKRARELHESFDIGYWQLNAYGEPLLHPRIADMIGFLRRELRSNAPVYITTHGLTLTEPRIQKLLASLPNEVMVSLHNDSQESYAATRSEKIGDFELLANRIFAFCSALIRDAHACSVRLSVLVNNSHASRSVHHNIRNAFADNPERFIKMTMDWQERFAAWADKNGVSVIFPELAPDVIASIYENANHGPEHIIPIVKWDTAEGERMIFISPRPVGTYANLLPYQRNPESITPYEAAPGACGFTRNPSLAIFANGRLGLCCLDLETTASFSRAEDHPTLWEALRSNECSVMFANLAFGISDCVGCSVCLGNVSTFECVS
jgi:hypothetical protein